MKKDFGVAKVLGVGLIVVVFIVGVPLLHSLLIKLPAHQWKCTAWNGKTECVRYEKK